MITKNRYIRYGNTDINKYCVFCRFAKNTYFQKIAKNIFANFSFDLIYARPHQSLSEWERELNQALEFSPPHLSLYQLTIEKGTKFFSQYQQKKFVLPDENLAGSLFDLTNEIMQKNGFDPKNDTFWAKREPLLDGLATYTCIYIYKYK